MKRKVALHVLLSFLFISFVSCANVIFDSDGSNLNSIQDLFLKNIILPNGLHLDEKIDADTEEYHLTLPIGYSQIDLTVVPNILDAQIKIERDGVSSNSFYGFPLNIGDNLFKITLSKDKKTAVYYLNITKWKTLSNYIKPDIPISNQKFGWHLSMHGNYIAVGAPEENTAAGSNAGAVYIFKRTIDGSWNQEARLTAPNAGSNDQFGHSVYIYNDMLLVGAPYESSNTSGIFTDTSSSNDLGSNVGAAYIFKRNVVGNWNLEYYVKPSDPVNGIIFGFSVALDKTYGETLLVNAPYDGDGGAYSGAVYVFSYISGILSQESKLKAHVIGASDVFGGSMYVKDTRIVIGAPYHDEGGTNTGAVYVFEKNLGSWIQKAKLLASNPGVDDYFGFSVVTYGNSILIGAPQEDSDPNLGLSDNSLIDSGIIYEFILNNNVWSETAHFKAGNAGSGDQFGWNMDFDNYSVIIGAPNEDGSGQGVNTSVDDLSSNSGAVYIFKKDINGDWEQDSYVKSTNSDSGDKFGHSVVIDDGRLLIVASDEQSLDSNDQNNNAGTSAGAVYFYE